MAGYTLCPPYPTLGRRVGRVFVQLSSAGYRAAMVLLRRVRRVARARRVLPDPQKIRKTYFFRKFNTEILYSYCIVK